jgi:hypothetical protein
MQVLVELPKFEELKAEAEKRGFTIEFLAPQIIDYHVLVKDLKGTRETIGYVHYQPRKGGAGLSAGGWDKGRLRIWVGRKVKVIGNLLQWMSHDQSEDGNWDNGYLNGTRRFEGKL